MGNKIFQQLLTEKIQRFKNNFLHTSETIFLDDDTGRLIHPGEFGMYREEICRDLLRSVTPENLSLSSGFVINSAEERSKQTDIVVYSKQHTPVIRDDKNQRFFPIETVVGIGEVKSVLTKMDFKEVLSKMAFIKKMRENSILTILWSDKKHPGTFHPQKNVYDQVFSFLICKKLDFDIKDYLNNPDSFYPGIDPIYRHNLILSVEDGLLGYRDKNKKFIYFPFAQDKKLSTCILRNNPDSSFTMEVFLGYFFSAISSVTILFPDVVTYMQIPETFNLEDGC